jgi:hypothetical protein
MSNTTTTRVRGQTTHEPMQVLMAIDFIARCWRLFKGASHIIFEAAITVCVFSLKIAHISNTGYAPMHWELMLKMGTIFVL